MSLGNHHCTYETYTYHDEQLGLPVVQLLSERVVLVHELIGAAGDGRVAHHPDLLHLAVVERLQQVIRHRTVDDQVAAEQLDASDDALTNLYNSFLLLLLLHLHLVIILGRQHGRRWVLVLRLRWLRLHPRLLLLLHCRLLLLLLRMIEIVIWRRVISGRRHRLMLLGVRVLVLRRRVVRRVGRLERLQRRRVLAARCASRVLGIAIIVIVVVGRHVQVAHRHGVRLLIRIATLIAVSAAAAGQPAVHCSNMRAI